MTQIEQLRLQRDAEHLHHLGARSVAEALAEIARRIGGGPAIASVLADYRRINPAVLRATGGDRFPDHTMHVVPR